MIYTLSDKETVMFYRTGRLRELSPDIIGRAKRKLGRLHTVEDVSDLRNPPGNRLHEPSGNREGQYSISINDKAIERRPTHPGEMLREEYMHDFNLSVSELASRIGVSRQSINELVHGHRSLSTEMAVRLARLFDDTAESWLNLQRNYGLSNVERNLHDDLKKRKGLAV